MIEHASDPNLKPETPPDQSAPPSPVAVTVTELHPTEVTNDALLEISLDQHGAPNSAYAKGDEQIYFDGDAGMLVHIKVEPEITELITPPPAI